MYTCTMSWMKERRKWFWCYDIQATSPLCYLSMDVYLRYLCLSWYHASLFLFVASDDALAIVLDQARLRRYVYEPAWWVYVPVYGLCVGKYCISNPLRNWKKLKVMLRFKGYVPSCMCVFALLNPNLDV